MVVVEGWIDKVFDLQLVQRVSCARMCSPLQWALVVSVHVHERERL